MVEERFLVRLVATLEDLVELVNAPHCFFYVGWHERFISEWRSFLLIKLTLVGFHMVRKHRMGQDLIIS